MTIVKNAQYMTLLRGALTKNARFITLRCMLGSGIQDIMEKIMPSDKDFHKIKDEYDKLLREMAKTSGKTIEELDKEITEAIEESSNVEDILIKSSEII